MKPLSVVVAQSNNNAAEILAKSLSNHFRMVNVARDLDQLGVPGPALPRTRTATAPDPEVAALIREATALARRKA